MVQIRRVMREIFNFSILLDSVLSATGLVTGWTIASLNEAVGIPVSICPPETSLWKIGVTFLILDLVGRDFIRRRQESV
jgi:hypothetical protein